MISYQLDYVVDEVLKNVPSPEQTFLKEYSNTNISKAEAKCLWEKIGDHKWNVSERLKRNVGFRVAATDYLENFYEPSGNLIKKTNHSGVLSKLSCSIVSSLKSYFISKSKVLQP